MGLLNPPFTMRCQEHFYWCWAAVAAAVQGYPPSNTPNGPPISQCDIADLTLGLEGIRCCDTPLICDRPAQLDIALKGRVGYFHPGRAAFETIQLAIDEFQRPLCARIVWDPDGDGIGFNAHFVVIHGYEMRDVPYVWVQDPFAGFFASSPPLASSKDWPLEEFANRYKGAGVWKETYIIN
jgi:hypothetical protein